MTRFLAAILFLVLFGLQDSDLSAKTKGFAAPSSRERKEAKKTASRYGTGGTRVVIRTSAGTIEVMLYDQTPLHRDNFIRLAERNEYNGVIFHRVIHDFMIQAGDPESKNTMGTAVYGSNSIGEPIPAEIDGELFHHRGALAAARQGDETNPRRESSGSQFYIVVGKVQSDSTLNARMAQGGGIIPPDRAQVYRTIGGTPHLDGAYTVFGRVVRGMKIVEKISGVPTDYKDRPRRDIFIKSMKVKKGKR